MTTTIAVQLLTKTTDIITKDENHSLPPAFTISAINTVLETNSTLINQIGQLRYQVWQGEGMQMNKVQNNNNQQKALIDNNDSSAILWAIHQQDELVATAKMNIYDDLSQSPTAYMHQDFNHHYPLPVASLTRLVVAKSCRGSGLGDLLDNLRVQQARVMGLKSILLMCPPRRAKALQKRGFDNLGKAAPSKLWPNAQWILMRKVL